MTLWRVLLGGLLLANLLFFGWSQSWFGAAWPPPGHSQREPERMASQVRPERFVLLGPEAARAAATAPTPTAAPAPAASEPPGTTNAANTAGNPAVAAGAASCLEAGPFTDNQLTTVNSALTRLGVDLAALTAVPLAPPAWLVFAGRFADAAARRTRLQAWQRQGVPTPDMLDAPREMAPGLVFSRHGSRAEADAALVVLAGRYPAVANVVRVVQAPTGAARLTNLRVAAANPALALLLRDATLAQQVRFTRCATP